MNGVNIPPVALHNLYADVLDARVDDKPLKKVPVLKVEVPYNEDDPYLGIQPQERISSPLTRPLHHYPAVYPEVPHSQIEKMAQKIQHRYKLTPQQFAHQLPDGHELKVKVLAYDAEKIYHTIKTCTTVGAIGGGALAEGAYLLTTRDPNIWNHIKVTALGFLAGSVVGGCAGRFLAVRSLRQETYIKLEIPTIYNEWQKGLTKETYELYRSAYNNYMRDDTTMDEFACNITLHLPLIPVKAPNGAYYEKGEIEKWLDKDQSDPLRNASFRKEDLVYDPDYVQKMTEKLKELVSKIQIDPNTDPLLLKGLTKVYNHLIEINQQVDDQLKFKLMDELYNLGATRQQVNEYIGLMHKHFNKKQIDEKDQEIELLRQKLNAR